MNLFRSSKVALTFVLTLLSYEAFSNSALVDLNNETLHARFNATHASNEINYSLGTIITDDKGELFYAGAYTWGNFNGAKQVKGGFGGRIYYLSTKADDIQALGLGGAINIDLPVPNLSVTTEFYYAPGITTSSDADGFAEFTLKLDYKVFNNASAFIGMRDVAVRFNERIDYTIDDGVHLGFELDF